MYIQQFFAQISKWYSVQSYVQGWSNKCIWYPFLNLVCIFLLNYKSWKILGDVWLVNFLTSWQKLENGFSNAWKVSREWCGGLFLGEEDTFLYIVKKYFVILKLTDSQSFKNLTKMGIKIDFYDNYMKIKYINYIYYMQFLKEKDFW